MEKKMIKNISLLSLLFVCVFVTMPVVSADVTCTALSGVVIDNKLVDIVHLIVLAIQVVVPILLVIFGMIDLAKAIMAQKEDEIKKGQQTFIKRLIAAVILFFVITIVKMLISFLADDNVYSCAKCFLDGSESQACKDS